MQRLFKEVVMALSIWSTNSVWKSIHHWYRHSSGLQMSSSRYQRKEIFPLWRTNVVFLLKQLLLRSTTQSYLTEFDPTSIHCCEATRPGLDQVVAVLSRHISEEGSWRASRSTNFHYSHLCGLQESLRLRQQVCHVLSITALWNTKDRGWCHSGALQRKTQTAQS